MRLAVKRGIQQLMFSQALQHTYLFYQRLLCCLHLFSRRLLDLLQQPSCLTLQRLHSLAVGRLLGRQLCCVVTLQPFQPPAVRILNVV